MADIRRVLSTYDIDTDIDTNVNFNFNVEIKINYNDNINICYFRQGGYVFTRVCLYVCLLMGLLKKLLIRYDNGRTVRLTVSKIG